MINIDDLDDIGKQYLICMYFAKMNKNDTRYKLRNNFFGVLANKFNKSVHTYKNIKDGYDSYFPDNGREGWKDNRIEKNAAANRILVEYQKYSVDELEQYIYQIFLEFSQEKQPMFISMRLAKPDQAHPVIGGVTEFEMDGLNVLKDDLKLGTQIFIVLGGDKGKSEVDWSLGLYALGHVSKEPYDIGYEQGKKSNYFKIMVTVDYKFPEPLEKNKLMYYKDTYNATFIGIEIKRSQTQAIGSLDTDKAIAVLRAALDYKLITKEKIEKLFDNYIVNRVLGHVKKLLTVNVAYGQDDTAAILAQYRDTHTDRLGYFKSLSLEELKQAYIKYNEGIGLVYPDKYNWWANIWKAYSKEFFWDVIENKDKTETIAIIKDILISNNSKSNLEDFSRRKWHEVNVFKSFVLGENIDDDNNNILPIETESLNVAESLPYDHNRIFYGAPGTGKSYRLQKEAAGIPSENVRRVTFHPAYTYSQFFGTYKPVGGDGDSIAYRYVAGPLLQTVIDAIKYPSQNFILIIEEINRADVAAVFGDTFQLLDRDENGESEYKITVSKEVAHYAKMEDVELENNNLGIPSNMYIWATMNSADQGVMPLDTAFKRRWDFEYIGVDDGAKHISKYIYKTAKGHLSWDKLRKAINTKLTGVVGANEDKCLGPFFISKDVLDKAIDNSAIFEKAIKSKVLMYLFEDAAKYDRLNMFGKEYKSLSELFTAYNEFGAAMFDCEYESAKESEDESGEEA